MLINQEVTHHHSQNLMLNAGSIWLQAGGISLTAFSPWSPRINPSLPYREFPSNWW